MTPNQIDSMKFLGRHLIALCVTEQTKEEAKAGLNPRSYAYPGTLVRLGDAICFLTAGHNIKRVQQFLADNQVEVMASLVDHFGPNAVHDMPIPFHLDPDRMFFVDDDGEGLDFGLIALSHYYLRLLAANRPAALDEKNWIHQADVKFDGYVMYGLPSELGSDRLSDPGVQTITETMFGVKEITTAPAGVRETKFPRFMAHINPTEEQLKSVRGMSGCPIFGFRKSEEGMHYWLVAIQSAWVEDDRVILGCPISLALGLTKQWLAEAEAEFLPAAE